MCGRAPVSFLEFDSRDDPYRRLRCEPTALPPKTKRNVGGRLPIKYVFSVLYILHEPLTNVNRLLYGRCVYNMVPAIVSYGPCGARVPRMAHVYRFLLLPLYVFV